jgi:hypothetical protein
LEFRARRSSRWRRFVEALVEAADGGLPVGGPSTGSSIASSLSAAIDRASDGIVIICPLKNKVVDCAHSLSAFSARYSDEVSLADEGARAQ